MRLIDADSLLKKRAHAKAYSPEMYVIGQGYVMDAPTVAPPERVESQWKGAGMGDYECVSCWGRGYIYHKFCPNCGAKMTNAEEPDDP